MKKYLLPLFALPLASYAACDLAKNDAGEYEVATFEDLQKVGVGDCKLDAKYRLTADIKANPKTMFTFIGTWLEGFSGEFHGAGHTISDLYMYGQVGLFGLNMDGAVDSLGLVNVKLVNTFTNAGAVVGWGGSGSIRNVFVTGELSNESSQDTIYMGGIAGSFAGTIENCYFNGKLDDGINVGGIVGKNDGTVKNSYAINTKESGGGFTKTFYLGTVAGINSGTVENCVGMNFDLLQKYEVVGDTGGTVKNSNSVKPNDYQKGAMKKAATYADWKFDGEWLIEEGRSEPFLAAMLKRVGVKPSSASVDYCSGKPQSQWKILAENVSERNYTGDFEVVVKDGKVDVDVSKVHATNQSGYVFVSEPVDAVVAPVKLSVTGLTAKDKVFDGKKEAVVDGTPALDGVCKNDAVSLKGTLKAEFENETVGADKKLVLSGLELAGDAEVLKNYELVLPELKASVVALDSSSSETSSSSEKNMSSSSSSETNAIVRGKAFVRESAIRTYFDGHSVTIEKNGRRFDLMGNKLK